MRYLMPLIFAILLVTPAWADTPMTCNSKYIKVTYENTSGRFFIYVYNLREGWVEDGHLAVYVYDGSEKLAAKWTEMIPVMEGKAVHRYGPYILNTFPVGSFSRIYAEVSFEKASTLP